MSGPSSGAAARAVGAPGRPADAPRAQSPSLEDGERRAIELAYRRHSGWLKRALQQRFGRDAAEDLSQEAFTRLQSAGRGIVHPRALLLTIATNAARQLFRKNQVRSPDSDMSDELFDDTSWQAEDQESELLLKQLIRALPPPLQDVFVLSRFEGLTYPEIAQRLGISTKTVEWRMAKALAICAARLRD
jgi:RNA polymerase sigma-70 factor (ECF subfamily)